MIEISPRAIDQAGQVFQTFRPDVLRHLGLYRFIETVIEQKLRTSSRITGALDYCGVRYQIIPAHHGKRSHWLVTDIRAL